MYVVFCPQLVVLVTVSTQFRTLIMYICAAQCSQQTVRNVSLASALLMTLTLQHHYEYQSCWFSLSACLTLSAFSVQENTLVGGTEREKRTTFT